MEDACGNQVQSTLLFQISDCVVAAPICRTNLSIVLQALLPGIDIDGDGDADGGYVVLPAVNFIGSPVTENCSWPDPLSDPPFSGCTEWRRFAEPQPRQPAPDLR